MTSDTLWARAITGRAKQRVKDDHSTDETLLGRMVESWRRPQRIASSDLQTSVEAICSSPELGDTFKPWSAPQREVALGGWQNVRNYKKSFTGELCHADH
jgi:hypothetical protein